MRHAVVFYPELRHAGLHALRARYDPYAGVVGEHVTLVFPLAASVAGDVLAQHVRRVLSRWQPFPVHLVGLEVSWDHWLLLGMREGRDELVRLHDELYTGKLEPHLRRDLPYAPHVGLGLFAGAGYDPLAPEATTCDEEACRRGRAEAEALGLDFWRVVDRLNLLELDDRARWVRDLETIPFGRAATETAHGAHEHEEIAQDGSG